MEYYNKCEDSTKKEIELNKNKGGKFSLAFDEWTSTSNKRYINVIVHSSDKFFNIGLLRMTKKGTVLNCIDYVEDRLREYNLSLKNAHGIHLAIIDIFYKRTPDYVAENGLSSSEEEDDWDFLKKRRLAKIITAR